MCVTVVLADVSCGLIDVQEATYEMCLKLIVDVFGAPHLFLSCCTASLVKGAACQSESYDYIYEGKRNFGPFACLAHCVTHAASCLISCQF